MKKINLIKKHVMADCEMAIHALDNYCRVNADVDFILSAVELLSALDASPGGMVDHSTVSSVRELQEIVAYSMATCSGVERPFSNKKLYDHIVQVSSNLTHEVQCY